MKKDLFILTFFSILSRSSTKRASGEEKTLPRAMGGRLRPAPQPPPAAADCIIVSGGVWPQGISPEGGFPRGGVVNTLARGRGEKVPMGEIYRLFAVS